MTADETVSLQQNTVASAEHVFVPVRASFVFLQVLGLSLHRDFQLIHRNVLFFDDKLSACCAFTQHCFPPGAMCLHWLNYYFDDADCAMNIFLAMLLLHQCYLAILSDVGFLSLLVWRRVQTIS